MGNCQRSMQRPLGPPGRALSSVACRRPYASNKLPKKKTVREQDPQNPRASRIDRAGRPGANLTLLPGAFGDDPAASHDKIQISVAGKESIP